MIPERFIIGCKKGNDNVKEDLKEARRRWDITREWRERERVHQVTDEKQDNFFLIKEHYPFYWAGRGKEGRIRRGQREGQWVYLVVGKTGKPGFRASNDSVHATKISADGRGWG